MAVEDYLCRETDTLVLPSKSFYPVKIPVAHYQLRHYISSSQQDLLYYASDRDVYCLNPATHKRIYITSLPFGARCTASGYGWVCVGGEQDGFFASIKVDETGPSLSADVDALLPLDLGNSRRLHTRPFGSAQPRVNLEKIGQQIVNSISIHRLSALGEREEDEVVAVLTNNDNTVRLYSLTKQQETCVLDLPFSINHATISPDGQTLVAVGDEPVAYFFRREAAGPKLPSAQKNADAGVHSTPPSWTCFQEVGLHAPPAVTTAAGYFTTAWSSSGALVALGSECGYITIFDADLLAKCDNGADAILEVIKSSRPFTETGPGAVRTMMFAPQPWDLLVWAEDQGRVCVADLRAGLRVKQILALNPEEDGLNKVELSDYEFDVDQDLRELSQEADFIRRHRRLLEAGDTSAAVNLATDYIESAAAARERRRQNLHPHITVVSSDNDPHGMTEEERQIVESLRPRPRSDLSDRNGATPRSINYVPNTSASASNDSLSRTTTQSTNDFPALSRSMDRRPLILGLSSMSSLRDFLRERATEPDISNSSAGTTVNGTASRSPNTLNSPTRADHYATLSTLYSDRAGAAMSNEAQYRLRRQQRMARNARDGSLVSYESAFLRRAPMYGRAGWREEDGVRSAGLAMSVDGRKLWCGTEEGIFEFDVDVGRRKLFPAVVPR